MSSTTHTIANIITMVRGIIIDRVVSGETNFFTDDEILRAINLSKNAMFGRRPEAFLVTYQSSDNSISTSLPNDYTSSDSITVAAWAVEPLTYYAASMTLLQKSKDSFYREASEKLLEFYERSI
jgi:hypothetical protein